MSVDLPAPLGPSRPTMSPARSGQRHVRERAAAAEMAGDVEQLNGVEVDAHASDAQAPAVAASAGARRAAAGVVAVERAVDLLERGDSSSRRAA